MLWQKKGQYLCSKGTLSLDVLCLDSLAFKTRAASVTPPSHSLSICHPGHLQRWSAESGSMGSVS